MQKIFDEIINKVEELSKKELPSLDSKVNNLECTFLWEKSKLIFIKSSEKDIYDKLKTIVEKNGWKILFGETTTADDFIANIREVYNYGPYDTSISSISYNSRSWRWNF